MTWHRPLLLIMALVAAALVPGVVRWTMGHPAPPSRPWDEDYTAATEILHVPQEPELHPVFRDTETGEAVVPGQGLCGNLPCAAFRNTDGKIDCFTADIGPDCDCNGEPDDENVACDIPGLFGNFRLSG